MKRFFPRPWLAGLLCALALPAWAAFTDNGDGTITDSTTGLVWDKCSRGQVWDNTTPPGTCTGAASSHTWAAALAEATAANSASHRGHADWRLPNRTELESLIQINAHSPAIDGTYFPATPNNSYWTSTSYAPSPADAWGVDFDVGYSDADRESNTLHVRLVRSGQWFGAFDALAVNGACGGDHGVAVLAAPSASLCSAGVAGSVTSAAAAFTWSCAGTGGGSTAACSAPRQYNVTPTAGAGGSISPGTAQAVTYNASTSFTVTPSSGYGISTVSGCGGSLAGNTYTTGAVTTNCTVSASFSLLPPSTYPIHIAASAGGSVVCSPNPVPHGGNATCTATASSGYRFTGWGGSCSGSASPCTLTNVTAPTNVSVQFAPAPASAQAIPTLGEWAMLLLTGLMGLGAMVALRRR
jgi:hypothetical protein